MLAFSLSSSLSLSAEVADDSFALIQCLGEEEEEEEDDAARTRGEEEEGEDSFSCCCSF
jgi:hypothetical protein